MATFEENKIKQIIQQYEQNKIYKRGYYKNKYHTNPEHKDKVKATAKVFYEKNKDDLRDKYYANWEEIRAKRKYNYYKKNDRVSDYIKKYEGEFNKFFKDLVID